ncbi:MAG: mannosyltransferase family protein [Cyanobacteria bacterium P01_E01_bin.42]
MRRIHNKDLRFVIKIWAWSRFLILLALWGIAPLLEVPSGHIQPAIDLQAFAWWDGEWYLKIAAQGYEYFDDGQQYSVAFFPLFPLSINLLTRMGISPELAGVAIANSAFLGAAVLLYFWVKEGHGTGAAKWATAVLVWCPYSLYGTVIYTEGLFFLLTILTLQAFEKKKYLKMSFFGILTTATRGPGIAAIPAFLWVSWREKRRKIAYFCSLAIAAGIFSYSLYCWWQFGDPLAFVKVQAAWGRSRAIDLLDWWRILMYVAIGVPNYDAGAIKDILHPLAFISICAIAFGLWQFRDRLGAISPYGGSFLILVLWLLGGDPFLTIFIVLGGILLLWHTRKELSLVATLYGFLSLGLILTSGRSDSSERLAYGIISLSMAAGIVLNKHPRFGYGILSVSGIILATFAIRFAQQLWIA